jgi:glycosyltransferase involved in cell wall biosynthesis
MTKINIDLFNDLKQIASNIPPDFGGGSPLSKTYLMARLALEYNLKDYVEIGIYKGRSFFPMAHSSKLLGGMAYGIDPYDYDAAVEQDLPENLSTKVNSFLGSLNFSQMYDEVKNLRHELDLSNNTEIIRQTSAQAIEYFRKNNIGIDMLHVDGNHDTKFVMEDVELYTPLVRDGGFIVLDDIDWDSVKPALTLLKQNCEVVFNNGFFAILRKRNPERQITLMEKCRLINIHAMISNLESLPAWPDLPEVVGNACVSIVVTFDQHTEYLEECLEGILAQKNVHPIELVICNNGSFDQDIEFIKHFIQTFSSNNLELKIPSLANPNNSQLKNCLTACTGQYVAICKADDSWIDCGKLYKQIDFIQSHPGCSFCFSDFYIYYQITHETGTFHPQQILDKSQNTFSTRDIILNDPVGGLSGCLYVAQHVSDLPDEIFDLDQFAWLLNIVYSQFGSAGHNAEFMSIQRSYADFSSSVIEKQQKLLASIDTYNSVLNYAFDPEFSIIKNRIDITYAREISEPPSDLAIIDDVFPHPLSAFRMNEFNSYLKEFERSTIYSSGDVINLLGASTLDELMIDYKKKFPEFAKKVNKLEPDSLIHTRLAYLVFLRNVYVNLARIEEYNTPFVFTLYPGGMFGIDNVNSDMMLRRVFSSPCFRKVIVTQKLTRDYLLTKEFCRPDQIEFIFGVVTPPETDLKTQKEKAFFGENKNSLDICFVAHKYTEKGIEKGYDIFIDVAKQLCQKYDNINFHVVGSFDENVLDVGDIKDRITFYGTRDISWFDEFYSNKDIILSPNLPFAINKGAKNGEFDGFPTGACTDAGLRKTAIFCTDELHLNNIFVNREDIVIIPHDTPKIVSIIEEFYAFPEKIKEVSEKGYLKIKQIYGFDAQMLPRIKLLRDEINKTGYSEQTDSPKQIAIQRILARSSEKEHKVRLLSAQVKGFTSQIAENALTLAEKKQAIQALTGQVEGLTAMVAERDWSIQVLTGQSQALSTELNEIKASRTWRVIQTARRILSRLLPNRKTNPS